MTTVEQSASFFVQKKILRELVEQCQGGDTDSLYFSVTLFIDGGVNLRLIPAKTLTNKILIFHPEGHA